MHSKPPSPAAISHMPRFFNRFAVLLAPSVVLACADPSAPAHLIPGSADLTTTPQGARYTNVVAFSPGGCCEAEFAVMTPEGRKVVQLTSLYESRLITDVTPDGLWFGYENDTPGIYGAWVSRTDGSQWRRLPGSIHPLDNAVRFSPDGRWITFGQIIGTPMGDIARIMLVDPLTWTSRQVIAEVTPSPGDGQFQPSWSPNSQEIAFAGPDGLERVRIDGTGRVAVPSEPYVCDEPAWSPTGGKIACAGRLRGQGFSRTHLFVTNARGRELRVLSTAHNITRPSWSPDGRYLVFEKGIFPRTVVRIAADGTGERELLVGRSPVWARLVQLP